MEGIECKIFFWSKIAMKLFNTNYSLLYKVYRTFISSTVKSSLWFEVAFLPYGNCDVVGALTKLL